MKIDLVKTLKVYEKNMKKLPVNTQIEFNKYTIDIVERMCQETFDTSIGKVTYVNCPNPFMKEVSDEELIRYTIIYGSIKNKKDEYLLKMYDELENRGHSFVKVPKGIKSVKI